MSVGAIARPLLALLYAAPLWALWRASPYAALAPPDLFGAPLDAVVALALVAFAGVVLHARGRRPLPPLLAVAAAADAFLLYPYSAIDWSRLLKDWGLARETMPAASALALATVPIAAAFLAHVLDHAARASTRYAAKEAPSHEREDAVAAVHARGLAVLGTAVAATALLYLGFIVLRPAAALVSGGPLAFAAPVVAGVLLAATAWAYLRAHGARARG